MFQLSRVMLLKMTLEVTSRVPKGWECDIKSNAGKRDWDVSR